MAYEYVATVFVDLMASRRVFHTVAARQMEVRSPAVLRRVLGTRPQLPLLVVGCQQSSAIQRYSTIQCFESKQYNIERGPTGNHCNHCRPFKIGVMWSCFLVPVIFLIDTLVPGIYRRATSCNNLVRRIQKHRPEFLS